MNNEREVSKEWGEKLALDYGIKLVETSTKANSKMKNAFFTLTRNIKAKLHKKC